MSTPAALFPCLCRPTQERSELFVSAEIAMMIGEKLARCRPTCPPLKAERLLISIPNAASIFHCSRMRLCTFTQAAAPFHRAFNSITLLGLLNDLLAGCLFFWPSWRWDYHSIYSWGSINLRNNHFSISPLMWCFFFFFFMNKKNRW